MRTLSTSVVPSGWFAGVFLFSVTVSCPFPSPVLWSVLCHVRLVSIVGRCWLVRWCELVSDFSLSDCNFCSAHGGLHVDTQVAVVGSFSFACHVTTRFWNKTTETKTSETPVFPKPQVFAFVIFGMLLMRCRSRLGTEAVEREREREQFAFIHQLDRIKRKVQPVFLFCDVWRMGSMADVNTAEKTLEANEGVNQVAGVPVVAGTLPESGGWTCSNAEPQVTTGRKRW